MVCEAGSFKFHCFIHGVSYICCRAMLDYLRQGGFYIILGLRAGFTFSDALQICGCLMLVLSTFLQHA